MKDYYVKVRPTCGNCVYECGIQLDPKEEPRYYCNKWGCKNPLPYEYTCDEFEFDTNILRPSVCSKDYFVKNKEENNDGK